MIKILMSLCEYVTLNGGKNSLILHEHKKAEREEANGVKSYSQEAAECNQHK